MTDPGLPTRRKRAARVRRDPVPPSVAALAAIRVLMVALVAIGTLVAIGAPHLAAATTSVLPGSEKAWTPLSPETLTATNGATLRDLGDGVILAEGANPDTVVYEIEFRRTELTDISALRIDVLPHASLPQQASGRAPNGNFVLSELEVMASRGRMGSKDKAVEMRDVVADHEQSTSENYLAKMVSDGIVDADNGWAADAHRFREARTLILVPKSPLGFPGGTSLTLRLTFGSKHKQHAIGCFRVSTTCFPDPIQMYPPRRGPADDDIKAATERGIAWLLERQLPDGSWPGPQADRYYGMSALAAYTLLQCGLSKQHPAIRAAIAYVDHHPMTRTYDVGCTLLAYKAHGDPSKQERAQELADLLMETIGNGRGSSGQWGYPFGHGEGSTEHHLDLSNTQYALLGLRAAAGLGVKIPLGLWERAARDLMKMQGDYGGFGYTPGRAPSASMTVAGIAALLIIRDELPESKRPMRNRLENAASVGEQWLRANWSVETNLIPSDASAADSQRWYYYYMYGLERVGSLANKQMIGGHDWHAEGARALLERQNKDGSWSTNYGEHDANTCFALMYLVRGTRSTGLAERPRANPAEDGAAFLLQSNQQNPLGVWVGSLGDSVLKRLESGERPTAVDWLVNGAIVATVAPSGENPRLERFPLQHDLLWNGRHEIIAAMRFQGADGSDAGMLRSAPLEVRVDAVEEPRHREAIFDNTHAAIQPRAVDATATSASQNFGPEQSVDGRFGTCWVSTPEDPRPTLDLRLRRPVRAAAIKLTSAHPWNGSETEWARPKEVEVQINGGKSWLVSLIDDVKNKQRISFDPTTVKRIRIRVVSVYATSPEQRVTGFKEVELIDESPPDDGGVRAYFAERSLIAAGIDGGPSWRYTFDEPDPSWTQLAFTDADWKEGPGPFGSADAPIECRTPWQAGKNDLWIRRTIELTEPPRGRLVIELVNDDLAEVYVNGVPAAVSTAWSRGSYRATAVLDAVTHALRTGPNVIAAHCKNTGGAALLDVAVRVIQDATR